MLASSIGHHLCMVPRTSGTYTECLGIPGLGPQAVVQEVLSIHTSPSYSNLTGPGQLQPVFADHPIAAFSSKGTDWDPWSAQTFASGPPPPILLATKRFLPTGSGGLPLFHEGAHNPLPLAPQEQGSLLNVARKIPELLPNCGAL